MQRRQSLVLIFSTLTLLFVLVPLLQPPNRIPVSLSGSSNLNVLADRATISLRVSSEGTKQRKVADDVRQTTDAILNLLRPLTLPPNRTTTTSNPPTLPEAFLPPLATLSVNTFFSHSSARATILGDTTTYTSSVTVTAEFRSLHPFSPSTNTTRTVIPASGFHHLALVLPSLSKLPHTKIEYLKWHLTPTHLASLRSEARRRAMSESLLKAADYTAPMALQFPRVRCVRFDEDQPRRRVRKLDYFVNDIDDDIRRQGDAARMQYTNMYNFHDEMDEDVGSGYGYGYEIEESKNEAFGLEPQSIEVGAEVRGDFVVEERGLIRAVLGFLV